MLNRNSLLSAPDGLLLGLDGSRDTSRVVAVTTKDPRVEGRDGDPGDLLIVVGASTTVVLVKHTSTDKFLWRPLSVQEGALSSSVAKLFTFTNVAAPGTNDVHALYDSAPLAWNGTFTSPATPRNLVVVKSGSWDGGTVSVTGTNQFDEVISELFPALVAGTEVGAKIFKTVVSAVKSLAGVTGNGASIGSGAIIGVPERVAGTTGLLFAGTTAEAVVIDPIYSSFDSTTLPDGAVDFTLSVNVITEPKQVVSMVATGADGDNSIAAAATNQYAATATYNTGETADLVAVATWTSSDTAVATVDAAGLATGVAAGTAVITAYYRGVTAVAATLTVT